MTIKQPWAQAIADGLKTIENRMWRPRLVSIGDVLAIHAGRSFDRDGADYIVRVTGRRYRPQDVVLGAVIATARLADIVTASESPWFGGPPLYGWVLSDVQRVVPVQCLGALSTWELPDGIVLHPVADG